MPAHYFELIDFIFRRLPDYTAYAAAFRYLSPDACHIQFHFYLLPFLPPRLRFHAFISFSPSPPLPLMSLMLPMMPTLAMPPLIRRRAC